MAELIEKSNGTERDAIHDEHLLSMKFDEWRCQYELVSRWIDHLDSCFGLLILVQLTSFASFSFLYFCTLLLAYKALALHMRYDVFVIMKYAGEIEKLIGLPLLGDFPLGYEHIFNAMIVCHVCSSLFQDMIATTVNAMACWLRLLIVLIPIYRMQIQVSLLLHVIKNIWNNRYLFIAFFVLFYRTLGSMILSAS